jgi:hypothetical protein
MQGVMFAYAISAGVLIFIFLAVFIVAGISVLLRKFRGKKAHD